MKENNPRVYVADRYNKNRQPKGDPDCKLGVQRRTNQGKSAETVSPGTPPTNPIPGDQAKKSEVYWGYGSGIAATKVKDWGEFVLAELTQTFNRGDTTYFHPLMEQTEQRLGFRPRFGAFDAAFDAFYVYEYFHTDDNEPAFAAVPLSKRNGNREFAKKGLPKCEAGLPMPLKGTFWSKTTYVHHERGRYVCPLVFPQQNGEVCPIQHKNWPKGCVTTIPTSVGARIRHQINRESDLYKQVYNQRTATERVNSQAKAIGIERPHLRNQAAITNQNTLIYTLINLRALQRIQTR